MVTTPVRVHDDVETPDDPQATIASKNTVPQARNA
jgi:hypothetical protein